MTYKIKRAGKIIAQTHSASRADRLAREYGGKVLRVPTER